MKKILIVVPALLIASVGAGSTFVKVRESLMQQRAAIVNDWAAVDAAIQDRGRLIRQFAEEARSAGIAEDTVVGEVTAAQQNLTTGTTPQDRIRANERLSAAQAKLLLASEIHPRRKLNRTLSRLEEQIRGDEERIAVARRKYNETLEHYNARIQAFPYNLVARISGFTRNDAYFYTEPF